MLSPSRKALRNGAKQAKDFEDGLTIGYDLSLKEVEQLFDKYIEEKRKNGVSSEKHELGQESDSKSRQRKSEVFHEVQD